MQEGLPDVAPAPVLSALEHVVTQPEPVAAVLDLDLVPDPATGITPAGRRRAALSVCAYAGDVEVARELLDALGLLEELQREATLAG
ncbi:MAG: hypothetical protein JWN17_1256 [Frankiales bacterium]|nr:hypothetical protein [Frankiales bacterium]